VHGSVRGWAARAHARWWAVAVWVLASAASAGAQPAAQFTVQVEWAGDPECAGEAVDAALGQLGIAVADDAPRTLHVEVGDTQVDVELRQPGTATSLQRVPRQPCMLQRPLVAMAALQLLRTAPAIEAPSGDALRVSYEGPEECGAPWSFGEAGARREVQLRVDALAEAGYRLTATSLENGEVVEERVFVGEACRGGASSTFRLWGMAAARQAEGGGGDLDGFGRVAQLGGFGLQGAGDPEAAPGEAAPGPAASAPSVPAGGGGGGGSGGGGGGGGDDDAASSSGPGMTLAALALFDAGTLPGPWVGPAIALGLRVDALRVDLRGHWLPGQQANGGVDYGHLAATLRGCWQATAGAFEVGPCGGLSLGSLRATPQGGTDARELTAALDLGAIALWRPLSWLGVRLDVDLVVPLTRPSFGAAGVDLHQPAAAGVRVALGPEIRIP
jgi:hypothetical protein